MKIEGVKVKDADAHLVVQITKEDVRSGSLKKASSCAAAKALCRQHQCEAARVHFSRAYIKKNGTWVRYGVPAALRSEVIAFDRGGKFEAGEYILFPIQPSVRLDNKTRKGGGSYKNGKKTPQRGNKPRKPYHVVTGVRARMQDEWWKDQ